MLVCLVLLLSVNMIAMSGTCIFFTGSSETVIGLKPAQDQCQRKTHQTQHLQVTASMRDSRKL
ncbi:hypothetical protein C2W62_30730 [Candidatus Entotheonella serta]|nr:hypothetical protein C2W62_30730 [Candidatus Entotheonella serta]